MPIYATASKMLHLFWEAYIHYNKVTSYCDMGNWELYSVVQY